MARFWQLAAWWAFCLTSLAAAALCIVWLVIELSS